MRKQFFMGCIFIILILALGFVFLPPLYHPAHMTLTVMLLSVMALGTWDAFQTKHAIKRNFPVIGHFRYLLEEIRPEIQQYFIESNTDGKPFSREERSIIYQRSKAVLDTVPFGTQKDVYEVGYEWVNHSLYPTHIDPNKMRVKVGGPHCSRPYEASILNISAMSFGSLSKHAVEALNGGAKLGGFAHNTGEGSITPHHLKHGGDIIWQIGTGYFGCRTLDGDFDPSLFKEKAALPEVKMIEIKLSQGAKPGHGGILPKEKVTPEVAKIRNVPLGKDVISPPGHKEFKDARGLLNFVKKLRELSAGKPMGFKMCLGRRKEFLEICKAMVDSGITPDFITVDGGEGGTGAAPLEFTNRIGSPGDDALIFIHNCLVGFNLRKEVKIIATGKISAGYGLIKKLALGADLTYAARSMMMALGCIQALRCHNNKCPTGVATQDKNLMAGLVVSDKIKRVATFHKNTVESVAEILGTMGLHQLEDLKPWHLMKRVSKSEVKNLFQIYQYIKPGSFLEGQIPDEYRYDY